jgi:hypothetical protein
MLTFVGETGQTIYAQILGGAVQWWNLTTAAFESYDSANWSAYTIGMTEAGASGIYSGPTPALPNGSYTVVYRRQTGNDAATNDLAVAAEALVIGAGARLAEATVGVAS